MYTTAIPSYCSTPDVPNGQAMGSFTVGGEITVVCNNGHSAQSGNATLRCLPASIDMGQLSPALPSCQGKDLETSICIQLSLRRLVIPSILVTHTLTLLHHHSFTHPITHSFTHSLTHSLILSLTHLLTHVLTHSLTHLLTHSLTHSLTLSLTHSLTHSLIHSLTHSFHH